MTNDHRADEALAGVIGDIKAFAISAVVLACVERDIFRSVRDGSPRQSFVAAMTPNEGLGNAVVDVLVANGYLRAEDGGLVYGAKTRALLDRWTMMRSWAREMRLTFDSAVSLARTLETGDVSRTPLAQYWPYKSASDLSQLDTRHTSAYSVTMAESIGATAESTLTAWDFTRYRRVLEIGGGYGDLAIRLAAASPGAAITILDLIPVADTARERVARERLADRITVVGGDAFRPVPDGPFDAVIFHRVIHDWDDESAARLFKNAATVLGPSGEIVIAEVMNSAPGVVTTSSAATGLMLALVGGRRRSPEELRRLTAAAGFPAIIVASSSLPAHTVVVARRA